MNMMVRDQEIKNLIHYAKSLGAKVVIRDFAFENEGEVIFEPSIVINVNKKHHKNKTQLIFTLLHETAHLKYARLNDFKFTDSFLEEVWNLEEQGKRVPKKYSKDIVEFEINSLPLMINIASELDIKIPKWKITRQMENDIWVYKRLGKTGYFPTNEEMDDNWVTLTERYKPK
jgi:hypothetical protein